jgi:hypothetical protein
VSQLNQLVGCSTRLILSISTGFWTPGHPTDVPVTQSSINPFIPHLYQKSRSYYFSRITVAIELFLRYVIHLALAPGQYYLRNFPMFIKTLITLNSSK